MVAEATLSIIAAGVLASFKTASKNGRGIKPGAISSAWASGALADVLIPEREGCGCESDPDPFGAAQF